MRGDVINRMRIITADVSQSGCGIVIVGFQCTCRHITMVEIVTAPALSERLDEVRGKIEARALRCNRAADEITFVAVSKSHPAEIIREAIAGGVTGLGADRVAGGAGRSPE